jgi:GTP-binding protein
VAKVHKEYCHRINTGVLNRIIEDAVYREEPSLHKGKRLRFFYATQVATRPPCFVCFVNYPKAVHFSYKRYLLNQLRQMIPLSLTPIKLMFREKTGKIAFSGNTREFERIQKKKEKDYNQNGQAAKRPEPEKKRTGPEKFFQWICLNQRPRSRCIYPPLWRTGCGRTA